MTATMIRDVPGTCSLWRVEVGGRAYRVTTYPGSERVFVEKAETGRKLTGHQTERLAPAIRSAISAAR